VNAAVDGVTCGVTNVSDLGCVVGIAPTVACSDVADRHWQALCLAVGVHYAAVGGAVRTTHATTTQTGMRTVNSRVDDGIVGHVIQAAHNAVRSVSRSRVLLTIIWNGSTSRHAARVRCDAVERQSVATAEGIH